MHVFIYEIKVDSLINIQQSIIHLIFLFAAASSDASISFRKNCFFWEECERGSSWGDHQDDDLEIDTEAREPTEPGRKKGGGKSEDAARRNLGGVRPVNPSKFLNKSEF